MMRYTGSVCHPVNREFCVQLASQSSVDGKPLKIVGKREFTHVLIKDDVNNMKDSYKHKFQRGQNLKFNYFGQNNHFCFFAGRKNSFVLPAVSNTIKETCRGKLGNFQTDKECLQTTNYTGKLEWFHILWGLKIM